MSGLDSERRARQSHIHSHTPTNPTHCFLHRFCSYSATPPLIATERFERFTAPLMVRKQLCTIRFDNRIHREVGGYFFTSFYHTHAPYMYACADVTKRCKCRDRRIVELSKPTNAWTGQRRERRAAESHSHTLTLYSTHCLCVLQY